MNKSLYGYLLAVLIAVAALYQYQASSGRIAELDEANDQVRAELSEANSELAAQRLSSEQALSELTERLRVAQNQLSSTETELAQAREQAAEAERALASQSAASAPVLISGAPPADLARTMVDDRIENMDLVIREAYNRAETQYGRYLDSLGITGDRRQEILQALAEAEIEAGNLRLSMMSGAITPQEFEQLMRGNTPSEVLARFLTEEQIGGYAAHQRTEQGRTLTATFDAQLGSRAPSLNRDSRERVVEVWEAEMAHTPDGGTGNLNVLLSRSNSIDRIRNQLSATLSEQEMQEVNNVLDARQIIVERMIRAAQQNQNQ